MDIYCYFRREKETSVTSAEPGEKGLNPRGKKSPSHYIHSLIYYYTYFPSLTWITIMINKFNIFLLIKKNEHAITSSLTYSYTERSREEERWSLQPTQKKISEDTEFRRAAKI